MVAPTAVSKAKLAMNSMRNAEESALSGADEGGGGLYTGKGKSEGKKQKGLKLKKKIAGIAIIAVLGGGGVFLSTTNSILAPAIEANFTTETDTQYESLLKRTTHLTKTAVQGEEVIKTTIWPGAKKYGKISNKFKKRLAENNIVIEGKGKNAKLVFTKQTIDADGKAQTTVKDIPANDFEKVFNSDVDFREAFQTARRGRLATFFDDPATAVLKRLGISRNLFENFKRTDDSETNTKNFRETMSDKMGGGETTASRKGRNEYEETDEDGNKKPVVTDIDNEKESAKNTSTNVADAETKAKSMIDGVADKFTSVGNWTCTVVRVMSMISVMVAANEMYQSMNFFMGLSENISKMKAGKGDASAINEVMNFFSKTSTTETNKYGTLSITEGSIGGGKDVVKQTGSPLQSNGMQMILAGAPKSDEENRLFSLERINNASSSPEAEGACMASDVASSLVSISTTIATLGTSAVASTIWAVVKGAATSLVLSVALSFIVPTVAKALFTNAFESALGIPAGALFTMGGAGTNMRLGRNASGQGYSSKEAVLAYNNVRQEVIALDAEIDRKNLSPFDASNKNTFLGSIAYSLLPLTTSSEVTNLSSLLGAASSSLSTLMSNGVTAKGEGTSYITKIGNCKTLEKIGAVGDNYCNAITTTDITTINLPVDDEEYQTIIAREVGEGCQEDGSGCRINPDGELAKYIRYCSNRDSPPGVVDQNILGELQKSGSLGAFRGLVGAIPIVGDLADLSDVKDNDENMPWATGERCGNTEKNAEWWQSEGEYYQRFVEDNRILKLFGAYENDTDPISRLDEEFEELYPTDDSYIGYMSRISGLLPEDVETTLAFIEYFDYINNYDPSIRIAMTDHPSNTDTSDEVIAKAAESVDPQVKSLPQVFEHIAAVIQSTITYADVRNRSFAV